MARRHAARGRAGVNHRTASSIRRVALAQNPRGHAAHALHIDRLDRVDQGAAETLPAFPCINDLWCGCGPRVQLP